MPCVNPFACHRRRREMPKIGRSAVIPKCFFGIVAHLRSYLVLQYSGRRLENMPGKQRKKRVREPMGISPFSPYRIEIKPLMGGRKSVLVCDCEEILIYTHEKVAFLHKRETVVIEGAELWCRSYQMHTAEVVGYIKGISFEGGKRL